VSEDKDNNPPPDSRPPEGRTPEGRPPEGRTPDDPPPAVAPGPGDTDGPGDTAGPAGAPGTGRDRASTAALESGRAPDGADAVTAAAAPAPSFDSDYRQGGSRRGFPLVATLALLLVLALAAGAGWLVLEAQRREAALLDRMQLLESVTEREVMDAGEQQAQLRQLNSQLEGELQGELREGLARLSPQLSEQSSRLGELAAQLRKLDGQVGSQGEELARFRTADRESWQLAEVEYLLRLANQRVILSGDTVSAEALLRSADSVLESLEDPRLHPVRRAITADLAALRAVPQLDTEGLYLRLSALAEQASSLSIFELPEAEERLAPAPAEDWQGRLEQGYEAALQKLSDYIIIRRRDVPVQALMDPQWEGLVRQNLRMLLEQAQVALLSGHPRLYQQSLERARHWVGQFFVSDERRAHAMDEELEQLARENVTRELPDIARSLQALEQALEARERGAPEAGP
jgi:uroporphyrin-III C-methyltransferase